MIWWVVLAGLAVWFVLALGLGIIVGRAVRLRDERG